VTLREPTTERAQHAVAAGLAGDARPHEILPRLLEALGSGLGWPVALAWEIHEETDGRHLRCAAAWNAPEADAGPFLALSHSLRLDRGVGLPGRVWETGAPEWVVDMSADPSLPRSVAAAPAGLRAAFCFPTRAWGEVAGAIELLAAEARPPDDELLAIADALGSRIGGYVERRRRADAARAGEASRRAMLETAIDCIVTMDHRGRVVDFNPAAERTFGYSAEEVEGREMAELIVPPALRRRHREGLARYLAQGDARVLDQRIEITGLRADGEEFPVELTITRIRRDGPPLFTGYLRDITDRKRSEAELRASRARIVEAADDARRRLERDLHDGAQQRLVELALNLRMARDQLDSAPASARELLGLAIENLAQVTSELREFARGVHPVALTEGGLEAALPGLVRRATVPVQLEAVPPGRLPGAVEAAAYFVVSEALTNVARYSQAKRAGVRVALDEGALIIRVEDDGVGGADPAAGSGLRGLTDRLAALEGRLDVSSPPGGPTVLTAEIPCAS
jgi:PAS domain S-box-containing protein